MKKSIMMLVFIFGLSGCGLFSRTGLPSEKIAVESEAIGLDNLIWLPDGRLLVFIDLPEKDVFGLRWYAFTDDWTPMEMALPNDERCYRGGY